MQKKLNHWRLIIVHRKHLRGDEWICEHRAKTGRGGWHRRGSLLSATRRAKTSSGTGVPVDRIDQKNLFFIILNQIPNIIFHTCCLAIWSFRVLIWQECPTDRKAMKTHAIDHEALIINALIPKSSSAIISPFSAMRSLGESFRIHYSYLPKT